MTIAGEKKESQRPSHSCSECARRKTRCSKEIPCSNCVRRGKSHLCRPLSLAPKTGETTAGQEGFEGLSYAAFAEVENIRASIDTLRSKVSGLETLLVQAFAKFKEERPDSESPGSGSQSTPHPQRMFPKQEHTAGDIPVAGPSNPILNVAQIFQDDYRGRGMSPSRHSGQNSRDVSQTGEERDALRGEEVEAAVALEFIALGRNRKLGTNDTQISHSSQASYYPGTRGTILYDLSTQPPNPALLFPTLTSIAGVIPPRAQSAAIIEQAIDTGFYHAAVHTPTFLSEVEEFWDYGDDRVNVVDPAWLALFFAQLSAGMKHFTPEQVASLGLSEADAQFLSKTHFDVALACLYRANFLEVHTLPALQAIVVLILTSQDHGFSNLFPTLLTTGISVAQDMGLHRLPSEKQWVAALAEIPLNARPKALIEYEIKKRVFWALTVQDWFSIPYRRTTAVQPDQLSTPLPSNARDQDLVRGVITNRPTSDYTDVTTLLIWIKFAKCLQSVFQHIDTNPSPSYKFLLEHDAVIVEICANLPAFMSEEYSGSTEGMPPRMDWVRQNFKISSAHKILTLHRPFLHRAFRDKRYETSRNRAISASRSILREGSRSSHPLWTFPYHISAAASVVCLDLFQRRTAPVELEEERAEVQAALLTLQAIQSRSSIASRAVALITNLLSEETRLKDEQLCEPLSSLIGKKRKKEHDFTRVAKRMTREGANASPPIASTSLSRLTSTEEEPLAPVGMTPPFNINTGFSPTGSTPTPTSTTNYDGGQFGFGDEMLPPEFLSVFLNSGFDPLEGAITSPAMMDDWLISDSEYNPGAPKLNLSMDHGA